MDPNARSFNLASDQYQSGRPRYPKTLYGILGRHCRGHALAWDCGCGNGQVAIDLAQHFKNVEASDINENQIAHSFAHPRIRYTVQNSEQTDFASASFDAICVAQCLHWFDLPAFFAEANRVLKKDGVFACFGYSFFHIEAALDAFFAKELLHPIDPYWSEKNRLLHRGYRDIQFPFQPLRCPEISMTMEWTLDELLSYLSTWSAVKLYDEANQATIIADARAKLSERFAMETVYNVRMDFFAYMGRKEA